MQRTEALKRHHLRVIESEAATSPADECESCGADIPRERRLALNHPVRLCTPCQTLVERAAR